MYRLTYDFWTTKCFGESKNSCIRFFVRSGDWQGLQNEARQWYSRMMDNLESDYYTLYKNE